MNKSSIKPSFESMIKDNVFACCGSVIGARATQEDTEIMVELNVKDHYLYGIFDGHGGKKTVEYIKENFVKELLNCNMWKDYVNLTEKGIEEIEGMK